MTKLRPLFEDVLLKVLGDLTPARCEAATSRSASYLRDASDPDKAQQLTVRDMLALDKAHLAYDGTRPLSAAVVALLDQAHAEIYVNSVAIAKVSCDVIREDGEAHLALFIAAMPNATDAQLRDARREVEQSSAAHANALATLCTAIEHRQHPP